MKVDLPTPGVPESPMRSACRVGCPPSAADRQRLRPVIGAPAFHQRDGARQTAAVAGFQVLGKGCQGPWSLLPARFAPSAGGNARACAPAPFRHRLVSGKGARPRLAAVTYRAGHRRHDALADRRDPARPARGDCRPRPGRVAGPTGGGQDHPRAAGPAGLGPDHGPHRDAGTAPPCRPRRRRTHGRNPGRAGGPDRRLPHPRRGEGRPRHPDRGGDRRHPDPDDPVRPGA